jgi:hypothetical protein
MALKKVRRPVVKAEEAVVEGVVAPEEVTEETVATTETPAVEETKEEAVVEETPSEETTEEATPEVEETPEAEEVKEEPKKETTKKTTSSKKTTTAKKDEKKTTAPKKETTTKKSAPKKIELKPVKAQDDSVNEEEGARATKKKVMKLTKQFLVDEEGIDISIENIATIINAFEHVLGDVTNTQSYKFMNGMIQVQQRNGQVFKSPKVDYFSYKAPRTVKTFTQDTENVDKYRGQYDAETKVFKADGKWNYDTKEFDPIDLEIIVGQEDA